MPRYHVNPSGNAGPCKAMVSCPFGDLDEEHYDTLEEAQQAYEKKQKTQAPPPVRKPVANPRSDSSGSSYGGKGGKYAPRGKYGK